MQPSMPAISNSLGLGGNGINPPSILTDQLNSQGFFSLYAGGVTTAGYHEPFAKNGVVYQVPVGKTCKVYAVMWASATAGGQMQLCSSTAAVTPNLQLLTAGVCQAGSTSNYVYTALAAITMYPHAETYEFAASTYPCVQHNSASAVFCHLICREV